MYVEGIVTDTSFISSHFLKYNRTSDARAICNYIYKPSIETDVCVGIVNRHRMTV